MPDARELVHQIDESRAGIAIVAGIIATLHLVTAALAGPLFRLHRT